MSSSSIASTTSILSKDSSSPTQPEKDYAAAYGNLQSSYGANGHAPILPIRDTLISKASESKSDISKNTSRQSRWVALFRALRTRRDLNAVKFIERDAPEGTEEAIGHSGANAGGVAPDPEGAPQSCSSDQKKDFNTAFATLQTSYGFGGLAVGASR